MINVIKDKLKAYETREQKYNYLREFCQMLILKTIDEMGAFQNITFVGGTALRIIYDLNRFSEDLDFCLANSENYNFLELISQLEKELQLNNLLVSTRAKARDGVASAFIKFDTILYEVGLSPHKDKRLLVKFEVDQRPPEGFKTELSMVNKEFLVAINHLDLPSLFSGKLHAFLCRKYTKGRDYYDLIWYLGRNVKPNFTFLNNAVIQTEHEDWNISDENFKEVLIDRVEKTDFNTVKSDIEPFLVDPKEIRFFDKDYFVKLIQ